MNTMFLLMAEFETLMAEFETSTIPLSSIAESYLGMKPSTADKKAGAGDLPIPTFRMGNAQKAPRMVHVNDLAAFIDKRRKEAKKKNLNTVNKITGGRGLYFRAFLVILLYF